MVESIIKNNLSKLGRRQGKTYLATFIVCHKIYIDIYKYGKGSINLIYDPDITTERRRFDFIRQVERRMEELFPDVEKDKGESTLNKHIWRRKNDNRN